MTHLQTDGAQVFSRWLNDGMAEKHPKRPRDLNQWAKLMVDIATGEVNENAETCLTKRARAGGTKGGPARAKALTPAQRSKIASLAAAARWKKG